MGMSTTINQLTKADRDTLSLRVAAGTLSDQVRFTEKPLESMLEAPEDADEATLKTTHEENEKRRQRNDELTRNAKTLKQILVEARASLNPLFCTDGG